MKLNFTLFVAFRYLFAKKKQNVINVISVISMVGIAISTAALVCVISVFNGFTDRIEKSFNGFDPELKIVPAQNKVFDFSKIENILLEEKNIIEYAQVVEDNALIAYYNQQTPFVLKGVDSKFNRVLGIDSLIVDGSFSLYNLDFDVAVVGLGLSSRLNIGVDYVGGLTIYVPRREGKINILSPDASFKKGELYVSGIFASNEPQNDNNILLVPIEFARKMFDYDSTLVSSVDLKLKNKNIANRTKRELRSSLGSDFEVLDRVEQKKDFFKIVRIERLIVFVFLAFIIFIAICNIISSLSMLLIEKNEDINILQNLGAGHRQVKWIFILEGWLISIVGSLMGIVLAITICLLQQKIGFIYINSGIFAEKYPVIINFWDVIIIFATVVIIGFFTVLYPVNNFFSKNGQNKK